VTDEARAIDRLARGDERAFEELATLYQRALYSHAYRMLSNVAQAEDAVQDAFLLAYRGRATFRGGSFKAWLFRILTNRCLDLLRDAKRRGTVSLDPGSAEEDDPRPDPIDLGPSVEELASTSELLRHVEEALEGVPAEQRAAVLLRDVEGFDYEEIARITSSELGTVKSRIHRGRLAVREHLIARGWRPGNPRDPRAVGEG
jgi:RNA polymerase sigma-70 factor (ECF subfamily)